MKLIVGLGNPGQEYAGTRHNVGFEVIDRIAARQGIAVGKRTMQSVIGDGAIGSHRVMLCRPMTYMNLSGEAVAALSRYYRVPAAEIMVVYDDVALATGQLRLRPKGSAGGHNGMANIIQLLGTDEIPRIRIGVGAARSGRLIGHVLSRFASGERALIDEAVVRASEAVECAVTEGFETAMNRFNVRTEPLAPSGENG
ncbi:MAG TPA: aminoacyl-tRNA hydrolase [Chthonomonadaceae bacterium]|nr:aminoacyl-tRNA hydrolase [Chthonomonadaceae bacterium]